MEIRTDDPRDREVARFLLEHLSDVAVHSPPESIHALGVESLCEPEVTLWTLRDGSEVLGCGALRELGGRSGEIKSMRTATVHRRKGVASALLRRILEECDLRGYERVLLETGAQAAFAPARSLYARFGFLECGPFGGYSPDPNSVFMVLEL